MQIGDKYYYSGGMMTLNDDNILTALRFALADLRKAEQNNADSRMIEHLKREVKDLQDLRESLLPSQFELF